MGGGMGVLLYVCGWMEVCECAGVGGGMGVLQCVGVDRGVCREMYVCAGVGGGR